MGTHLVKWGDLSPEEAQAEREEIEKGRSGGFFKFKVGKNVVRMLPGPPGRKPYVKVWQHYIEYGDTKGSFPCPYYESGGKKPCIICQKIKALKATGNTADFDIADEMEASEGWFWNLIDRTNEEAGPQILRASKTVHDGLLALVADDPDTGEKGKNIVHPYEGHDVIVVRKGERLKTKYTKIVAVKQKSPLSEDEEQLAAWISGAEDLSRFSRLKDEEAMEEALDGIVEGEIDDDEDEDEKPKKKAKPSQAKEQKPAKRASRTAEDDMDDEDDDE